MSNNPFAFDIPGLTPLFDKESVEKPERPDDKLWEVQVKGGKCSSSWKISVIRKGNKHGHESWGWFDDDKLLISHNGGPCHWPIVEFVWDAHMKTAHELCAKLNNENAK